MENKNVEYNIGLDIGVGSVGWCVTDDNNKILKKNNRNMWGSRIFEEAKTAAGTRNFRSTKRRLSRRKERINILQSLMIDDMEREYPNFFQMLRETSLDYEDKIASEAISDKKYNLFSSENETDKNYYDKFKTIYHLRKYLMQTTEKVDIRLVYLAIHHIIKYRGNFLYDGDFSSNSKEINEKLEEVLDFLNEKYQITLITDTNEIIDILKEKKLSRANKKEKLIALFDFEKEDKQVIVNTVNAILGYSTDLNKIFGTNIEKSKIAFSNDIENEEEMKECLQENSDIYDSLSSVYSWFILQDILKGKTYISEALIEKYNKFSRDLEMLKRVYKIYFKNEYAEMFRKVGINNYVAYNGKNSGKKCKKCKPEEFFTNLKKKIKELPEECEEKEIITKEIEENNFLIKLNVTDNGAIPHQLHEIELEKILENQAKFYKTLEDNKENILKLFRFRIPYYIGPLAKKEENHSWIVRKSEGKIRPWNFEEIVDEDATAEKFIRRMTNKCTYLINEDVMPKQSLLYSKYCVLNELNNIKVDNHRLSISEKRDIIDKVFKKRKKVTAKMIRDYYRLNGRENTSITGLVDKENFMSNMASYIDMERIIGKVDETNIEECEEIIYWITIFEEKKILKRKIKQKYKELTDKQIDELCKLRYTGWSRLSKKLITGLKANDGDTIMDKLEKTTLNFMQIINEKEFGFDKKIEELMPKKEGKLHYQDIAEIPTSPANKRAIWQSICIVNEITKIMKKEPKKIYIEFARTDEAKRMKDKRIEQLLKKYKDIESQVTYLKEYDSNVYKELKKQQDEKVLTEKMYLYYLQNGKCLYSGKTLNLEDLSLYEVDHIIPRSYVKDDSIDNKALVLREENQRKTDNLLLKDEIINSRMAWWKSLLDANLISQNKYYRLIRRKMFETDSDREKFVQRQLVETRQITKYVTNLLKNEYESTEIFALRAGLTHEFREKYKVYKNRNVNNYHHAQDAYIISTIGNIIEKNWKGTKSEFKYSEYVKNYIKDYRTAKEKHGMIIGWVGKYIDSAEIKKIMTYKDCFISRMLEEQTGEFYNQTLYSPIYDPKNKPVIPLKNGLKVEKYGGYSGENKAYYVVFEYVNKKGNKGYQLIGIPVKIAYDIKNKKLNVEDYIKETYLKDIEYTNFAIIRKKILKNQEYLDENNEPMRLCSDSEIRTSKELVLNNRMQELIYLMNSEDGKIKDEEKEKLEDGYSYMFNYLVEKLQKEYKAHSNIYIKLDNKIESFKKLEKTDKKSVINGLIDLMETGQGNLKAIGLTDREGRKRGQNFKTEKLLKMTFVDKSVTGMYERRFKINGMENSNN